MAEDFKPKRQSQAVRMVAAAGQILEAVAVLEDVRRTVAESGGGFQDDDFVPDPKWGSPSTSLVHLNEWTANTLVNIVGPELQAALDGHLEDNPASATRRQMLLKSRS
jgi:hypothetical protein